MKKETKLKIVAAVVLIAAAAAFCVCCDGGKEGDPEEKPPEFSYVYGAEQTVTPYWENEEDGYTVIYNEVVTPIRYGDAETATGYLAYEPYEIISVRDYTLEKEYGEGDYTVDGNAITVSADGSMPYICNEWLDFKNIPDNFKDFMVETPSEYVDKGGTNKGKHVISEGSLTRTNNLCVTYAYKSSEQELGFDVPEYSPENFARFLGKLEKGEPVRILVFGDSIFTGASASSVVGFEPGLPAFFDLIRSELAQRYYDGDESKISVDNESVGATTSEWGAQQVESGAFDASGYDIVMVSFGMNDGTLKVSSKTYVSNMTKIVNAIREKSPGADFVVVGPFTPNPKSVFSGNHSAYVEPMQAACEELNKEGSGCTYFSMYEMTTAILKNKQKNNPEDGRYQYVDISANYTNHPNDFTVRLYAGSILSLFVKF